MIFLCLHFPVETCHIPLQSVTADPCCCKRPIGNYKYFVSGRKQKNWNLPFENQLFVYIHYCAEININLLLNTCNFHRKVRYILSLILSENTQNVHVREAKFQNLSGKHAPDPLSALAPSALDPIFARLTRTLNCSRRTCYYQWVIVSTILRIF